jgi:hypothetical protein
MPQYLITFAMSIEADNENEAKIKAMEFMHDPDPWSFHEDFGCSIEEDLP